METASTKDLGVRQYQYFVCSAGTTCWQQATQSSQTTKVIVQEILVLLGRALGRAKALHRGWQTLVEQESTAASL
jgi:hypothetical protein